MKLSRPSPAMVVSLVALVFAMTGTGLAATGVLITRSSQIKNGVITGAKIKAQSITGADLALNSVGVQNLALTHAQWSASVSTRRKPRSYSPITAEICPNGTIVYGSPCGGPPATQSQVQTVASQVTTAQTTATAAQTTANAVQTQVSQVAVPVSTMASTVNFSASNVTPTITADVGVNGNPAPIGTSFSQIGIVTPAAAETMTNAEVKLLSAAPANVNSITAVFVVNGATTQTSTNGCTFDPSTTSSCVVTGPVQIPAGSTIGWVVIYNDLGWAASQSAGAFTLSLAPVLAGTNG